MPNDVHPEVIAIATDIYFRTPMGRKNIGGSRVVRVLDLANDRRCIRGADLERLIVERYGDPAGDRVEIIRSVRGIVLIGRHPGENKERRVDRRVRSVGGETVRSRGVLQRRKKSEIDRPKAAVRTSSVRFDAGSGIGGTAALA